MPPQPGMFALPYSSTHKARPNAHPITEYHNGPPDIIMPYREPTHPSAHHMSHGPGSSSMGAGPSRVHEDPKREKRKREPQGMGRVKDVVDIRREEVRMYNETIAGLQNVSMQLAARPETSPAYNIRLLPLSTERSALLAQFAIEEKNAIESTEAAYELESQRVKEEWERGHARIRERLLEGIEERRRRAREEKDGEGAGGDASLDSQSRPHITRKLRNKLNTSPPPTPNSHNNGSGSATKDGPIIGVITNPHSLSIDELPAAFPLPLTAYTLGSNGTSGGGGGNSRRKAKGGGGSQAVGQLGKSVAGLSACKEAEINSDLDLVTKANKRRRAAPQSLTSRV